MLRFIFFLFLMVGFFFFLSILFTLLSGAFSLSPVFVSVVLITIQSLFCFFLGVLFKK